VVLVDPPGSSLYSKVAHGVAFAPEQSERSIRRHRYDTVAEGIGLDRVTRNLQAGLDAIDDAVRVSDQEALDMAHWLLEHEGMWVGSSSAMNVVGAVRTARSLPPGSSIVTLVCDGGHRHVTRFWNRTFCVGRGLAWPGDAEPQDRIPECLRG
jgi:cysteine synthase A